MSHPVLIGGVAVGTIAVAALYYPPLGMPLLTGAAVAQLANRILKEYGIEHRAWIAGGIGACTAVAVFYFPPLALFIWAEIFFTVNHESNRICIEFNQIDK